MNMFLDPSVLPKKTLAVFNLLSQKNFMSSFYLSGGTGLALYLKHRESEDLDFFSRKEFNPDHLINQLLDIGKLENVMRDPQTLNCFLQGVKLQYLRYSYRLLRKPIRYGRLEVSSLIDIAATKLITISARGSKKDFIDLYCLLPYFTLPKLFVALKEKYTNIDYNEIHILKSLVYFTEANEQPMPRMLVPLEWAQVKKRLRDEVGAIRGL